MTAAVSGKVVFPSRKHPYDPQFIAFLGSVIQTNPRQRPTVDQIKDWCEKMLSILSSSQQSL